MRLGPEICNYKQSLYHFSNNNFGWFISDFCTINKCMYYMHKNKIVIDKEMVYSMIITDVS